MRNILGYIGAALVIVGTAIATAIVWAFSTGRRALISVIGILSSALVIWESWKVFHSPKPAFCTYWLVVTLVIISLICACIRWSWARQRAVYVAAQITSNNNWCAGAYTLLAAIFIVSAMLAGFGEPLLVMHGKKAVAQIEEKATDPKVVEMFSRFWNGTDSPEYQKVYGTTLVDRANAIAQFNKGKEQKHEAESEYPSWFHTIFGSILFIGLPFVWVWSRTDEFGIIIRNLRENIVEWFANKHGVKLESPLGVAAHVATEGAKGTSKLTLAFLIAELSVLLREAWRALRAQGLKFTKMAEKA
ncbi:MAG TPA: hypothetical protein PLY62_08730 [Bacteroidales bacterium]|nr:MAG: hypothetical protein BWY51_00531 [Parcubacteria group bacterium ADurb.Bin316]HOZ55619.1 hypothetical protein [bacterium]HPH54124.1 hypothetical protein [Bacteroidales bacterium]